MTIDYDIDVAPLTTFGISGRAAALLCYDNVDELMRAIGSKSLPRPLKAIGEGSNLLFVKPFEGTLIKSSNCNINFVVDAGGNVTVEAGAGLSMDTLVEVCCERGLWGLENLSGIPGTVGASVVQNVGAYGVEASDIVVSALVLDSKSGEIVTLTADEMDFGYRRSMFKSADCRNRYIVLQVTFALSSTPALRLGYKALADRFGNGQPTTPADVREFIISMRETKLPTPAFIGSAGSFFKNPEVDEATARRLKTEFPDIPCFEIDGECPKYKLSAAWLIDHAGLKGATSGGAAVWHKQPLVIVNATGDATADDVTTLANQIISTVEATYGVKLSPEVEYIG